MTMQRNLSALFCASALALSLSACSDNKAPATDAASTGADASQSGTSDKIKKSGTIVLGYRDFLYSILLYRRQPKSTCRLCT